MPLCDSYRYVLVYPCQRVIQINVIGKRSQIGHALDIINLAWLCHHWVKPEWCLRDFRLRLSHGRNHGSEHRLERATLTWAVYRNFTPAPARYERKRHYRHPGLSPLAVAGFPHNHISYLDALEV